MFRLYSASEIIQKLKGVTPRQILDIAEKGLILPARDTTGAGSPRLYDFQNIFEICLCLAVRGRIPAPKGAGAYELIQNVIQCIREETARAKEQKIVQTEILKAKATAAQAKGIFYRNPLDAPPFDVLLIDYDTENSYRMRGCSYEITLCDLLAGSKKYRPQNYCTYNIEVLALWKYLEVIF